MIIIDLIKLFFCVFSPIHVLLTQEAKSFYSKIDVISIYYIVRSLPISVPTEHKECEQKGYSGPLLVLSGRMFSVKKPFGRQTYLVDGEGSLSGGHQHLLLRAIDGKGQQRSAFLEKQSTISK